MAKEIPFAEHVPFLGLENVAKQIKRTVFSVDVIKNEPKEKMKDEDFHSLGTGFIVVGTNKKPYAITCSHVVKAAIDAKKQIWIGLNTTQLGYIRLSSTVIFQDAKNDFAIMSLVLKQGLKIESIGFQLSDFAEKTSLTEGKGILYSGYPLGIGIKTNKNHPIVRFGIIAQYAGENSFLIDAVSSHGNSGSPVVLIKENKLAGMVVGCHLDSTSLFDNQGRLRANLPDNAGLGIVITAQEILTGIKRIEAKPLPTPKQIEEKKKPDSTNPTNPQTP